MKVLPLQPTIVGSDLSLPIYFLIIGVLNHGIIGNVVGVEVNDEHKFDFS